MIKMIFGFLLVMGAMGAMDNNGSLWIGIVIAFIGLIIMQLAIKDFK